MSDQNIYQEDIIQENEESKPAIMSDVYPENILVLPVAPRPVFPGVAMPFTFSGERNIKAIVKSWESEDRFFGVVLVKEQDQEDFFNSELFPVGTLMKVYKVNPINENNVQVFAQAITRFSKVNSYITEDGYLKWKVNFHNDTNEKPNDKLKAYTLSVISSLKNLIKHNTIYQEQIKLLISHISIEKPGALMDLAASMMNSEPERQQEILETFNLIKRAEKLLILLKEEIELSELQTKIQKQIDAKVSKQQKEFFLREQLKAIKKELGIEKDDKANEIEKIENKIKDLPLSEEAKLVVVEELEKLKIIEPASSEFHVTRTYLNTIIDLPWGKFTEDNTDIKKASEILDRDHYGLEDVKNTILESISTIIKRGSVSGSIICLVGPPGTGKTSIGKSIAEAMNRKFFRFSVGGMRDEAVIKGHRRTYIGALPGKILQSLKRTGSSNPVIMLDEIDKIGKSYQGDPASALLEVLDPEQNTNFLDHYLDIRYDLSNILFLTTANQLDTIPQPLLDRMEIIKLPGYILEEKVQIANKYIIPKQLALHGLTAKEVKISDQALAIIIDQYAREAGVRNLEHKIKKIMRRVNLKQAEGFDKTFSITIKNVEFFLGKPIYNTEQLYRESIAGVTLGLAWTALGGSTLYIEASATKGAGGFKQTGQLGNVMQESAQIAYSYIRSHLSTYEELKNFFETHFIHLHVPAGATPKDGPSAGITMALALFSLAGANPVRNNIAMTGEITLTGKVLPVGGIREKVIAARRVKIFELILPIDNKRDFEELPEHIKEGITVHYADFFDDVLRVAY